MLFRSSRWLPLATSLVALLLEAALVFGDADFDSVRVLQTEDWSGRTGDPDGKYWHESVFHPHYDGRFADHELPYEEQKTNLTILMQSYLATMIDLGAETWIMHGTLMGWWWNRKIMPWDSDIDVQVSESTIDFLASYYNMTVHKYRSPEVPLGRNYMLEINPNYINGSSADHLNMIDGRWIDTLTGVFIDITTVRPKAGHPGILSCKDKHIYEANDIFPLRDSIFENQPVKIPYSYAWLLEEEYGRPSLIKIDHEDHHFNTTTMEWERVKLEPSRYQTFRPRPKHPPKKQNQKNPP